MRSSEFLDKLAPALVKAQSEWPDIPDTKEVSTKTYSYKYAELTSIIKLTTPVLAKNGLAVIQLPAIRPEGPTLCTRILHESGQWVEEEMLLSKNVPTPQEYGALISYMSRYCMKSALKLATGSDDDGQAAQKGAEAQRRAEKPRPPVMPKAPAPRSHAPETRPASQQLTIVWSAIKKELNKDDVAAREFIIRVTGKKTTSELMSSDLDRLLIAIKEEKKRMSQPDSNAGGPSWGEDMPLTF